MSVGIARLQLGRRSCRNDRWVVRAVREQTQAKRRMGKYEVFVEFQRLLRRRNGDLRVRFGLFARTEDDRQAMGQRLSGISADERRIGFDEIGTEVQLALHAGGAIAPLVVDARVIRRSAVEGAGLEFLRIDPVCEERLRKLVLDHPRLLGPDAEPAVVGEIVDGEAGDGAGA